MLIKISPRLFLACIAIFYTFISVIANAQVKPNLVLLPIEIDESLSRLESDFGAALEEGLQQRYTVFYGAEVEKLLEKEYAKIDCTAESCNQALAVAFNGELIADASVKSLSDGYLVKLRVTNVLTNQAVETKTESCEGCNEFEVIRLLKAVGANNVALAAAPVQKSRLKIKSSKPKEISSDDRAILIFDSTPSGAELFINDEKVGTTPYQGLSHYIGEQLNIKLVAQYHKPLEQTVELVKPINQLEAFSLEAGTAFIQVAAEEYAKNTKVFIDGEEKGVAPLNLEVPAGQHKIYLKTPYTTSSEQTITLNDGAQQQVIIPWGLGSVKNTPLENIDEQAILIFDTQPSGAEVLINGQSVGKTPYQGLNHKKQDKLEVSIKEPTHRAIEFDVELLESITTLDDFILEKGKAKVTVLTEPFKPNMQVFVNGKSKGIAPLSLELDVGSHTIEARSDQQNTESKTIRVNDGDNQQVLLSFFSSNSSPKTTSSTQKKTNRGSWDTVQSIIDSLVDIPAGSFMMGSYYHDTEQPLHQVHVSGFKIMKYEVTQVQWKLLMGDNPSGFSKCGDNCPVENVNWNDIQTFIKKLNQLARMNFRLPSEAEWEYAARAGSATKYSWGDTPSGRHANGTAYLGWPSDGYNHRTAPVASLQANDFGLYDMFGNVWEWSQDCWNSSYSGWLSSAPEDGSAWESENCDERVLRGGSWNSGPDELRSTNRSWSLATSRSSDFGFRLVHD